MIIRTLSLVLLALCLSCNSSKIRSSDVRSAQKLLGVDFSREQIKTLRPYLNRNRSGFDSMRVSPVKYDVAPAMILDPFPLGYERPAPVVNTKYLFREDLQRPEDLNDLAYYSVADLSVLIKEKKVSSLELTQLFISRIKQYDTLLESVITLLEERALEQAQERDVEIQKGIYRGPLHGIPYGTKDLMSVAGYPTTWGAAPYKEQVLEETATVIGKLDEAGAVLIAKLVSGALARGDVWFGGRTKNPWDLEQGASGSSAGSGSATAAGLVPFALGTETLGSITSPSTRNGVTGLRPTYGTVSRAGVMSLSWSMDKIGPMGRTAQDCAIVFEAIKGQDAPDPMSMDSPFSYADNKNGKDLKIGYFKKLFDEDTTETGDNARILLEQLDSMGFELLEAELPESLPWQSYDVILRAEAGAFFDELVRSGRDAEMVEQGFSSRANSLRQSRFIPAVEYIQANRHRRMLIEEFYQVMSQYDVILTPTFGGKQLLVTNLTGNPVVSVPSGFDEEGHPTSISILGNLFDEGNILEFANLIQQNTDHHLKHPPKFK